MYEFNAKIKFLQTKQMLFQSVNSSHALSQKQCISGTISVIDKVLFHLRILARSKFDGPHHLHTLRKIHTNPASLSTNSPVSKTWTSMLTIWLYSSPVQ